MLVLLRHAVKPFWPDLSEPYIPVGPVDLGVFFINGWMGVDLFFVLSGFLITAHLLKGLSGDGHKYTVIKTYAKRRFFRIAPVYYLVLTVVVLGLLPFFPYPESREELGWRYFYHLIFMQDYFPSDIMIVFWSLAVEIKFYLLAPFLVLGLLKFKKRALRVFPLMFLLVLQPLIRWFWAAYVLEPDLNYNEYFLHMRSIFHLSLDGMFVGMLGAVFWADEKTRDVLSKPVVASFLLCSGLAVFLGLGFSGPLVDLHVSLFDKTLLPSLVSLGFGGMLLGLLGQGAGYRIFTGSFFRLIALISYSLYLVHLPLLYVAEMMVRRVVDFDALSAQMQFFAFFPFFFIVSMIVAGLLYVFVEKPFIDWAHQGLQKKEGGQS